MTEWDTLQKSISIETVIRLILSRLNQKKQRSEYASLLLFRFND